MPGWAGAGWPCGHLAGWQAVARSRPRTLDLVKSVVDYRYHLDIVTLVLASRSGRRLAPVQADDRDVVSQVTRAVGDDLAD